MGHEDDLGAKKGGSSHVFDNIIVIADQNTCFPAMEVEDHEFVAGREVCTDKGVKFPVFGEHTSARNADIGVIDAVFAVFLEESSENNYFGGPGNGYKSLGTWPGWNDFSDFKEAIRREMTSEGVSCDATLMECDDI